MTTSSDTSSADVANAANQFGVDVNTLATPAPTPATNQYGNNYTPDQINSAYAQLLNSGTSVSDIIKGAQNNFGIGADQMIAAQHSRDPTQSVGTDNYIRSLYGDTGTPPAPGVISSVQPSSYTPAAASSSSYTAQGYTPTTYDGTGSQAAPAAQWQVTPDQLVENRTAGIIDANSPLMQRAAAEGRMAANESGLVNSSLAVGAAQNAVLDRAVSIATPDAATYGHAASQNAAETNTTNRFNADQAGQTGRFNAGLVNQAASFSADAANRANEFGANSQNQVSMFNANAGNAASQFNADQKLKAGIANLDANNRLAVTNLEGKWHTTIQSQASANQAYQTFVDNVGRVQVDPNMDAGAKQAAVNQQAGLFNDYMTLNNQISGLNLGSLINFDPNTNTGVTPAPAPATAPTQGSGGFSSNDPSIVDGG